MAALNSESISVSTNKWKNILRDSEELKIDSERHKWLKWLLDQFYTATSEDASMPMQAEMQAHVCSKINNDIVLSNTRVARSPGYNVAGLYYK